MEQLQLEREEESNWDSEQYWQLLITKIKQNKLTKKNEQNKNLKVIKTNKKVLESKN